MMESIREIAKRLVDEYHRKYPNRPRISGDEYRALTNALKVSQIAPPPAPVVEAAIQMEALLNEKDRDWLERLRIRV